MCNSASVWRSVCGEACWVLNTEVICESFFVSPRLRSGSGHRRLSSRRTSQVGTTVDNWHFSPSLSRQHWTLNTLDWTNASLTGLPLPFGWIQNVRASSPPLADFRGPRLPGKTAAAAGESKPTINPVYKEHQADLPARESAQGTGCTKLHRFKRMWLCRELAKQILQGGLSAEMKYNIPMAWLQSCIVHITGALSLVQNDSFIFWRENQYHSF